MGAVYQLSPHGEPVNSRPMLYNCFLEVFAYLIDYGDRFRRIAMRLTGNRKRGSEKLNFWLAHFEPLQLSVPV